MPSDIERNISVKNQLIVEETFFEDPTFYIAIIL